MISTRKIKRGKKSLVIITVIFLLYSSAAFSQSIIVSGRVSDKEGRAISNATILVSPGGKGITTGKNGEYYFRSNEGKIKISARVLGYKPETIDFKAAGDTTINIYLQILPYELDEVEVTGDQVSNIRITRQGNMVLTPASMKETPRLFSEPDLLKSLQLVPGVTAGKDGSSEIYVRGSGSGQNIIYANGCYFFLPGHFMGMISPIDLDFLESAELYKDYIPAELGGGAGSVIKLRFKEPRSASVKGIARLGALSSGFTFELPFNKQKLNVTGGLKRGNYAIYEPLHKKLVSEEVSEYLPSGDYAFYDGYLNVTHASDKLGKISYLMYGSYDRGSDEIELPDRSADTVIFNLDRSTTGWRSIVHALQWDLPLGNDISLRSNINYNRLSMQRESFHQVEKRFDAHLFDVLKTTYSFAPATEIFGYSLSVSQNKEALEWSAGFAGRSRNYSPNILFSNISYTDGITRTFGQTERVTEPAAFISAKYNITQRFQIDGGFRLSGYFLTDTKGIIPEPRLRLVYNAHKAVSAHINYLRLSQTDHSTEGSKAGLRNPLWLPVSKDFGPEISDVVSAGLQGDINNKIIWTLDGYYKKMSGMTDYKSGASFVYDTTFVDLLEKLNGRSYGVEAGLIKYAGNLTGSVSYTYSRSQQEFSAPEGVILIPSNADRPHNLNLTLKYSLGKRTSFGINWVYASGLPATIYMHETTYGEYFNRKNNIRFYDYYRFDLSFRQVVYKRKFTVSTYADIYNVFNYKNTYFFKEAYDWTHLQYYYRNITLFPIMPTLTVLIDY